MKMFLNQQFAKALDVELMRVPGFSLDQLMELAGVSVSVARTFINQIDLIAFISIESFTVLMLIMLSDKN